jgi:Bacterial Ig-like domain
VAQAARAALRESEHALRRLIAAALFLTACASPGMPPGGPIDTAAPQIVSITPDSGTVGVKPKEIVFRFDEVVAEKPPSVTTLADLFLISPRDGVPDASWHREAIAVRPPHGWRANTPYTVIMLRGLADIRGNVRNTGATTFFSTGPTIPRTHISGSVFDWVSGNPAAGALVESFVPPDTLHPYVALVDSSGRFTLEHLPPAKYTVRAYLDRNKNLSVDPSEPWDSLSVVLADTAATQLLVFVHDTVPPHILDVAADDSLTLRIGFDRPIDPGQTLTAANFSVIGPPPDSARIPIASGGAAPRDTTPKGVAPSARPPVQPPVRRPAPVRADTTPPVPKPVMSRPSPISTAIIHLTRPLVPKTVYRIRSIGIRGLLGYTGNSEHTYTAPAPAPPKDSTGVKPRVPPPATPQPGAPPPDRPVAPIP